MNQQLTLGQSRRVLANDSLRVKETLIKWPYERIAVLRGARKLAYPFDMSRLLRAVRLAYQSPTTI